MRIMVIFNKSKKRSPSGLVIWWREDRDTKHFGKQWICLPKLSFSHFSTFILTYRGNGDLLELRAFFSAVERSCMEAGPADCTTSLGNLLQCSTALTVETFSPHRVWRSQEHFTTTVSLLTAAHLQKEPSSVFSGRRWQVAITFPQSISLPDQKNPHLSSHGKCSGHGSMALRALTWKILHGHTLKVPARNLQIHILPKMKIFWHAAPWNIYLLWLNLIQLRLSGSVWELVLWVGGNSS